MIQTIASVACVKWRSSTHPQQLASSSTVVDPTINVWDVLHPFVPIACFDGHRSAVTDVAWVKSSGTTQLFSCSTDHAIVSRPLSTALKPIEHASTSAIAVAPRGGFATFTNTVPNSRRHDADLNAMGFVEDKPTPQVSVCNILDNLTSSRKTLRQWFTVCFVTNTNGTTTAHSFLTTTHDYSQLLTTTHDY